MLKLYWGDTGVALHLAGTREPEGEHLENLVLHDLLAWRDARLERAELCYRRTTVGEEVDFVIEQVALAWLQAGGWPIAHGPEIAPDMPGAERSALMPVPFFR